MDKIKRISFEFKNNNSELITGDCRFQPDSADKPLVIFSHGFKGFKDWGFIPYLSENIALSGAIAVSFNFSRNGNPGDDYIFRNPEIFAKNSVSLEIKDLNLVIEYVKKILKKVQDDYSGEVLAAWNGKIYLVGHSLGAVVSLMVASQRDDVTKVGMIAPIAKFDRYTTRQKDLWKKDGKVEFTNQKTGQGLSLDYSFLKDIADNSYNDELHQTIRDYLHPVQIIHGRQDLTVPITEPRLLLETGGQNFDLKIIEKTGHTFGTDHPFTKPSEALDRLKNILLNFLSF